MTLTKGSWRYRDLETGRESVEYRYRRYKKVRTRATDRHNICVLSICNLMTRRRNNSRYNLHLEGVRTICQRRKLRSFQLTYYLPLRRLLHHLLHDPIQFRFHLMLPQTTLARLICTFTIAIHMLDTNLGELFLVAGRADCLYGSTYMNGSELVSTSRA